MILCFAWDFTESPAQPKPSHISKFAQSLGQAIGEQDLTRFALLILAATDGHKRKGGEFIFARRVTHLIFSSIRPPDQPFGLSQSRPFRRDGRFEYGLCFPQLRPERDA
jgi:hypothetical protein